MNYTSLEKRGRYFVDVSSQWLLWLLENFNNIYASYKFTHFLFLFFNKHHGLHES